MSKLSAEQRKNLPASAFALPEKRMFPINDEIHREKAVQLAPRALHAGSITAGEAATVRRKAKGIGHRIAEGVKK